MDPEPPAHLLLGLFVLASTAGQIGLSIFLLIILIICSALISGSEVAFFSLSAKDLIEIDTEESETGHRIIKLLKSSDKLLATILICNNFINIAIVILSAVIIQNLLPETTYTNWGITINEWMPAIAPSAASSILSFVITVGLVTFLLVLFGEITPKLYASAHRLSFAQFMSRPLTLLQRLLNPIATVLVYYTDAIEKRVQGNQKTADKKELDRAIDLAVSLDENPEEELDILKGILKFGDISTKQIMKSRVDVEALDIEDDYDKVLDVARASGYSRLPVYKEDFDNIEGILYIKDLLGHTNQDNNFEWQKYLRKEILYVPETKKINELLKEFQLKRMHMGIVVDEYGGSSGIVTLEDIMEEVLGDIKDEFDHTEDVDFEKLDNYNYVFEGKTLLNDMARITDIEIDFFDKAKGDADSLAGLILEIAGMIPQYGEEFEYEEFKFKILSANKRRVEKIQLTLPDDHN